MGIRFTYLLAVLGLSIWPLGLSAQTGSQPDKELVLKFETVGMTGSGDHAPFWHTSNRQGLPSVSTSNGYMHLATLGSITSAGGLGMDYGLDMGAGAGLRSELFLHQLYIDLHYRWLGMSAGMKERWGELKNPALSTGSLTWSGNSSPIPQVTAGIPEYTRIPLLGSWFSVKGYVGYGRFTDDGWRSSQAESYAKNNSYTDGILFHSKDLFIRFGDIGRFPFEATLGLEMYAMFGGTLHNRKLYDNNDLEEYRLPSGRDAYIEALFPFNEVGGQGKENGNTLGSWHLSFDYVGREWGVRAYYEHFFEDHSSLLGIEYKSDLEGNKDFVFYGFRRNWFDGLFGIEVNLPERYPVRNVVLELLNTRGQSGPIYKAPVFPITEGFDGCDAMYNHELYDSYTLYGYAIGSPVLVSPVYNSDHYQSFRSNRVIMYHIGIDGQLGDVWDYRALFTNTTHWGTYESPFNEKQSVTSCLLEGSRLLGDAYSWRIGLSVGFDLNDGDLIGNNTGVMVTFSKLWKVL